MPSTVNGIGTWYYGKDHLVTRNDRCEFCGSYEELKSYDTTLYFVVVFIPLIPLGRKRIIDECPRCKRHRATKLAAWERQKSEAILNATQAWQQDRANKDKAIGALGTAIAFHDPESFRQLAGPVGDAFSRDADVQIFLGDAYDLFGEAGAADSCYRAALANRPDEPTREALARFHLRQTHPADAEPLLTHILTDKIRPKALLLLGLAETYQAVGDHESAYRIVDEVGTAFPDLLSEPSYEKIRRSVSKHRGTGKVVRSKGIDRRDGIRQTSWLTRHLGLVILGAVVLIAATWYLGLAWSLGKHTVSLVNGTNSAYTAEINGKRYTIPAMNRTTAAIGEGMLKISVPGSEIPPQTVQMRTNFWRRPWNRRTMVINPDRTAIVFWEQTQYGENPDENYQSPYHYHVGEALYELEKVDYLFTSFPPRLKLSDRNKPVTKTRIDMAHDDSEAMAALAVGFSPAQQIEFLRKHLGDRPLRVQFHRMYQGVVELEQPDYDVTGEYRKLLEASPEDKTLIYLLARSMDDREEANALFRKAAEAPQPSAYANFALSYDAMNAAQYDEALRRAEQARKLEPDNEMFLGAQLDALEALGRYDEAVKLLRAGQDNSAAAERGNIVQELRMLASKADPVEARTRLDEFCKKLSDLAGGRPDVVARVRVPLEGLIFYAAGDMPAWRASNAARNDPDGLFATALDEGKVDAAQSALAQVKPETASEHLLVYIVAKKAGRSDVADAMWTKGLELMRKGHRADRKFAQVLTGSDPPSDKELNDWNTQSMERCIVLTAAGVRFPQKQAQLFAEAKKLNFSKRFPQRLIDQIISGGK